MLLVDDHDLVRLGIKRLLEDASGIKVVGEAKNGEDAVRICRKTMPNVVLMDVKMPGIGGYEATRKLLRMDPDLKVLIVTICTNDIFSFKIIASGRGWLYD